MEIDIKTKDGMLQRLKKSVFVGFLASVLITLFMLVGLSSSNFRRAGIVFLGAIIVIFILKIIFDIVLEKFVLGKGDAIEKLDIEKSEIERSEIERSEIEKSDTEDSGSKKIGIKRLSSEKRLLANALFVLFAISVFICTSIAAIAPAVMFTCMHDKKAEKALSLYEEEYLEPIQFETKSGVMTGWFLHNAPDKSPVVLYFGGNGEDAASRMRHLLENSEELSIFDGCNIACVDYPGYGNSEGSASEKSFKQAGLAAYDSLTGRKDVSGVIVMGYSIGTGVANYVASQRQPLGMILMAPYADGYDLYNSYFNIFYGPLKLLVSFKMKSANFAKEVNIKPLLIASNADEVVPYKSSRELFEKYKKGCNFVTIDNIRHNQFWDTQEVLTEISQYIASVK